MKVIAARADSYDSPVIEAALEEIFEGNGGIEKFVLPGERILLKPNLVEGMPPEKAVNTHPEVMRILIRMVKATGGIPLVGDSPGIGGTVKALEKSGIMAVCRQEGAIVVPFDTVTEVSVPAGRILKNLSLAKALITADKVISVAKMKTHTFMGITGSVKNLFGFVVGTDKARFHLRMKQRPDFADMLIDLAGTIQPVFYLVDGVLAMEGNGPRNGQPRFAGVLLGSADGFAVDAAMAEVMGFDSAGIPLLVKAAERGLLGRLAVSGSGADIRHAFRAPATLNSLEDRLPGWLVNFFQRQFTAKPVIMETCMGCRRCIEHCPPGAMLLKDGKAAVDLQKCIRCYCCQELCPHDALQLDDGFLLRFVKRFSRTD